MKRAVFGSILATVAPFCIASSSIPTLGNGVQVNAGYYVLLEKDGDDWKVDSVNQTPPQVTDASKQEILVFSSDLAMVEPYYSDYVLWYESKDPSDTSAKSMFAKGEYACFSGQKKDRPAYNPCDSSLTLHTDKGSNTVANVMVDVLSLGTAIFRSGNLSTMEIDPSKIKLVLSKSDAIRAVKRYRTTQTEQWAFSKADSSIALKNFIANFQNNDPAGLVSKAQTKLPAVEAQEAADRLSNYHRDFDTASTESDFEIFINKYQSSDPDNLVPKARVKLKELVTKQEAREQLANAELAKWRNSLQVGDETNCGEVLELRRSLVKVNFPVLNYGNEHWIRKDLILKPGAGCQFVNGNYVPPYSG